MIPERLHAWLLYNGYKSLREIEGQGICGLQHLLFTKAVVCGLNQTSYAYRYCYHTLEEAMDALIRWDGKDHPPGNWIVRKGEGGDLRNPGYRDARSCEELGYPD